MIRAVSVAPRRMARGRRYRRPPLASNGRMSTVACLHHLDEPFLGLAEAPLRAAGLTLAEYDGALPDLDEVDGIISFGGGASAGDLEAQPALRAEADLLAEAVARDMPVLGLCLG